MPDPVSAPPGSHIDVAISANGTQLIRSYSIVDVSADGRRLAISVLQTESSRGGSTQMHRLCAGQPIRLRGPVQNFALTVGASRYLLVAGGIGITALIGMAAALRRAGADYRLVYLGRNRSRMPYLDDVHRMHGERLTVHVSEDSGVMDIDDLLCSVDAATELYMCGPADLMQAIRLAWSQRRLPEANLRFETFGAGAATAPFLVRVPRLGRETVVSPEQTMLEALTGIGVDVMSDCLKGECGLCAVDVLAVQGAVEHRDVFYSRDQQLSNRRLCACVSRVVAAPHVTQGDAQRSTARPAISIDIR